MNIVDYQNVLYVMRADVLNLDFNSNHGKDGRFASKSGGPKYAVGEANEAMTQREFLSANKEDLVEEYQRREEAGEDIEPGELVRSRYLEAMNEKTKNIKQLSEDDADEAVYDNLGQNLVDSWFREANSAAKPRIVEQIISNQDTRNATMSVMYDNYKYSYPDSKMSFNEFLDTPIKMYRGGHGQEHTKDDIFSAYTYDRKIAEKFAGSGENAKVYEAEIKPRDTYGSVFRNGEAEIMVPSSIAPNGNKDEADVSIVDYQKQLMNTDGGRGSGNWGHAGRPGKPGGSASGGGVAYRVGTGAAGDEFRTLKKSRDGIKTVRDKLDYQRQTIKDLQERKENIKNELGVDSSLVYARNRNKRLLENIKKTRVHSIDDSRRLAEEDRRTREEYRKAYSEGKITWDELKAKIHVMENQGQADGVVVMELRDSGTKTVDELRAKIEKQNISLNKSLENADRISDSIKKAIISEQKRAMDIAAENFKTVDDCKSSKDVTDYLRSKGLFGTDGGKTGYDAVDFDKADVNVAKRCCKTAERVVQDIPEIKGKIPSIKVNDESHDPGLSSLTYAYSGSMEGQIVLNARFFGDESKFDKEYKSDVASGFHPQGSKAEDVVAHEMTHSIDRILTRDKMVDLPSRRPDGRQLSDPTHKVSEYCVVKAAKDAGMPIDKFKEKISRYATKGDLHHEALAEAVASVYGTSPSPEAQAVYDNYMTLIKNARGDSNDDIISIQKQFLWREAQGRL